MGTRVARVACDCIADCQRALMSKPASFIIIIIRRIIIIIIIIIVPIVGSLARRWDLSGEGDERLPLVLIRHTNSVAYFFAPAALIATIIVVSSAPSDARGVSVLRDARAKAFFRARE